MLEKAKDKSKLYLQKRRLGSSSWLHISEQRTMCDAIVTSKLPSQNALLTVKISSMLHLINQAINQSCSFNFSCVHIRNWGFVSVAKPDLPYLGAIRVAELPAAPLIRFRGSTNADKLCQALLDAAWHTEAQTRMFRA